MSRPASISADAPVDGRAARRDSHRRARREQLLDGVTATVHVVHQRGDAAGRDLPDKPGAHPTSVADDLIVGILTTSLGRLELAAVAGHPDHLTAPLGNDMAAAQLPPGRPS